MKSLGLNGLISCQVQRAFLPTGFPVYLMGKLLWNDKLSFDEVAEDYFLNAFGQQGENAMNILKISPVFPLLYSQKKKYMNK